MFKELFSARSLQTAAISLAFGLIGAMALALIGSIFFLSAGSSWASKLSMVPGLSGMMSDASGSGTVTPNFFQFLILVMVLGVSGQLSPNITGGNLSMSSFGVSGHLWMPVGLPGVALVLGTAFGAYWFARKFAIRFKWTGIISSVIVGVVMGFVYLILAAIFPLTLGAGSMGGIQAKAILTGVSARTYFMTLLLAAIGAFFGYLLAQYASDSNNVFTAAWKWAHRTRGFVRTLLDAAFIYAVVFTVIGFICLIMLSSSLHNGQMFMLFPILLPYLSFLTFALGSFGAVGITASGNIANLSLFGISNQYVGSISAPWQLWLVFVVFLITTFYIALRAAARNIYDPAYAGWQHSWKSPVATLVIWLIVTFLFTSVTLGYTMQSDTSDVSLNIAAWYLLVAAVWSFLIEVVALTFGPAMVLSMGGAWKLFVGGTVRPPRSPRMRRHAERTLVASRHRSPRPPATQARSSPSADSLAPAPERRPHPQLAPRFRAFPFRAFRFPVLRFRGFPLPAPTPRPFRPKVVPRLSKFLPALLPLLQLHLSPPFRWLLPPPRLQPRP